MAWPVVEGVLDAAAFERAVDWITTRSLQWRIWVEAGFASEAAGVEGGTLRDVAVWDAIIDVSSERPRVAYLRDVTMLEVARAAEAVLASVAGPERVASDAEARTTPAGTEAAAGPAPLLDLNSTVNAEAGLELNAGLKLDEQAGSAEQGAEAAAGENAGEAAPAPGELQDRRSGRWTTGGQREAEPRSERGTEDW